MNQNSNNKFKRKLSDPPPDKSAPQPKRLNSNICNVSTIESTLQSLSFDNFTSSNAYLSEQINNFSNIISQPHIDLLLTAYDGVINENNIQLFNVYYNPENKLLQFRNHQLVNNNMPPNHKFQNESKKHSRLADKNFDKVPEMTATFDINKILRIYSSRTGARCIHSHKIGCANTLRLRLYDYLGYQSNLCEGISEYFNVVAIKSEKG
eukprot:248754_1